MKTLIKRPITTLPLTVLIISGCASPAKYPNTPNGLANLTKDTPLSCQYKRSDISTDNPKQSSWYFIREKNRTESRNEATQQGEIWQRDAKNNLSLTHVFYGEKAALDYTSGDLKASGRLPSWQSVWSIIDPNILGKDLLLADKTKAEGVTQEIYTGRLDEVETEVTWLPTLQLPSSIRRISSKDNELISLENCLPIKSSTIKPTSDNQLQSYRNIDYSDLGDMETDPLVQKIISLTGGHTHGTSEQKHEHHQN